MKKLLALSLLLSFSVQSFSANAGGTYFIEWDKDITEAKVAKLKKSYLGKWSSYTDSNSSYFKRITKVIFAGEDKVKLQKIEMMKGFVKREGIVEVGTASVIASANRSTLANDPLVSFQWSFDFLGQVVVNEFDDLENVAIKGDSTSDIQARDLDKITANMKRNAIVAVIDTGVDYNHPDLKGNIYLNEVECENGEIPFKPETSLDDNKFAGDCKGWDFTGKGDLGTNRPEDFVGHGTHISGIIAAVRNNKIGMSGVSNKIKILPIKVLSNKSEDSQAIGTSDRLAEAILYATSMKVDVINLSLGWPISYDKDHLRNAVLGAIENGITVVAAAGNNDHSEPIFPCSYKGVICVGSIDPDKKFSDFSNFGGHVDVLAPGNNILSTIPTANTPLFFDIKGYELKSGTSQAAPYISALAAILKASEPGISENQVKAKIFNSAIGPYKKGKKYANGGQVHFDNAIFSKHGSYIQPDFKNLSRIEVGLVDKKFSFRIDFENLGVTAKDIEIELINDGALVYDQAKFKIKSLIKDGVESIEVSGKVTSINAHLFQKLKLKVHYNGREKKYTNELRFYVDFNENKNIIRRNITKAIPDEVLSLSTINQNHGEFKNSAYYSTKIIKGKGIVVSAFEMNDKDISKVGSSMIQKASKVLSVHRLDMNFDGKTDYLVRSLIDTTEEGEEEKSQTILYAYFNDAFKPLYTEVKDIDGKKKKVDLSKWKLKFEQVILQELDNFSLVPFESKEFGKILIPVFLAWAKQPEADANPNPFTRLRRRIFSSKIFYFVPERDGDEVSLITRTFNSFKFVDAFKKKIGFKPFEQVYVFKMFKQDLNDIQKGQVKILMTHESKSSLATNYIFTLTDLVSKKWSIDKIAGDSNLNLANFAIDRAIDLSRDNQVNHENNLNIVANEKLSPVMWEQVLINKKSGSASVKTIVQPNRLDPIQIPIKTYVNADTTYRFFQTPSRIFMQVSEAGVDTETSIPVHISSFLPGVLFQEQHYPIVIESDKKYPALYVDSTQIASRNIYTIIAKGKEIFAPMSLNVNVPEKCITKNPQSINGVYHYALLCLKKRGKGEMIYFPVKEQ
jgi:cell wall-associated protease